MAKMERRNQPVNHNKRIVDNQSNADADLIDLFEVFDLVKKKFFVFVLLGALGALCAGAYTKIMITPTYASQGTIYLTPLVNDNTGMADYTSLSVNSRLIDTVMSLMKKDNIMTEVAQQTGMPNASEVRHTLSVSNEENTEIITVRSVTTDPELSKNIVTTTINVFIEKMQKNLNVKNIEIVDAPKLDYRKVGPNLTKNTVMGGIAGLAIATLYVLFLLLTDNRLKSKEQTEKYLGYPVLIEVPKWK